MAVFPQGHVLSLYSELSSSQKMIMVAGGRRKKKKKSGKEHTYLKMAHVPTLLRNRVSSSFS